MQRERYMDSSASNLSEQNSSYQLLLDNKLKKQILEYAPMFKTAYPQKMLYPTIKYNNHIKKHHNPNVNSQTRKIYHRPSRSLMAINNKFIVGVKEIQIIDIDSAQLALSPKNHKLYE